MHLNKHEITQLNQVLPTHSYSSKYLVKLISSLISKRKKTEEVDVSKKKKKYNKKNSRTQTNYPWSKCRRIHKNNKQLFSQRVVIGCSCHGVFIASYKSIINERIKRSAPRHMLPIVNNIESIRWFGSFSWSALPYILNKKKTQKNRWILLINWCGHITLYIHTFILSQNKRKKFDVIDSDINGIAS